MRNELTLTLWTIQPHQVLKALDKSGRFRTDGRRVDRHFRAPYQWLASQMRNRGIGSATARYPLWAWYQFNGEMKKRPDLRTGGFAPSGTKLVLLQLELPAGQALLSDFELWHYPLNFWYLPDSEADRKRFERKYPPTKTDIPSSRQAATAAKRRVIETSWEKIFDLDWSLKDYAAPRSKKSIQATFWELRAENVISAQQFIAR